jgi:hypothetical protein
MICPALLRSGFDTKTLRVEAVANSMITQVQWKMLENTCPACTRCIDDKLGLWRIICLTLDMMITQLCWPELTKRKC